jgi:hypothetical protein
MEALGATFDENMLVSCAYFKTMFLLNNWLLHGHRLRQISRLIYITTTHDGDMIG